MERVLLLVHTLLYKNSESYFIPFVLKPSSADVNSIMSI